MSRDTDREEIAIIGMAGRFPGAQDIDEFWSNLCAGKESIRPFTSAELTEAGVSSIVRGDPDFVNAGAVMSDADGFDAAFFGMTRREAELTDPQHRVFLECAWGAIEHAGYDPQRYNGRIGVFGGVAANTYFQQNVLSDPGLIERTGNYPLLLASEREYAITRVAYKLGLEGPALSVNTACSTSAVAVHLAAQSLLSGESDLALAGGARIRVPLTAGYLYQEDGILSPDGHCRAFDADARGTVAASGVAIVALKRLSDATRDRDTVYAIIKGSAVNNDGAAKIGYTAPGMRGQVAVVQEALGVAEVSADTIGMIEAHGTGTSLGDPIEVAALTRAFRVDTNRRQFCALGSLKTNIGHLDAAAGVAGIIKAALSLHHAAIPPSLNFRVPNPQIDFTGSPFFVNTELRSWERGAHPRRAGVSSFGLGGTNAHVVLEEAPAEVASSPSELAQVLTVSAQTEAALVRASDNLADSLVDRDHNLGDVAFTMQLGRRHHRYRRSVVASSPDEAADLLRMQQRPGRSIADNGAPPVTFLFPGGGSQYPGMARRLYKTQPAFRLALDACADSLRDHSGLDLDEVLYRYPEEDAATERLSRVSVALPALFSVEYALAQLWIAWGVEPDSMIGHSLGEYVAATIAGVFSLDVALQVVAERGRLMESAPSGAMLSAALPLEASGQYVTDSVSLAVVNTPENSVFSGDVASIAKLAEQLAADDVDARPIPISVASHSHLMDPILTQFGEYLRTVEAGIPRIPFISNVTGTWITDSQATNPEYWATHLRSTVKFADGVGTALSRQGQILIEVGPGQTLSSLARQHPAFGSSHEAIPSLPHRTQDTPDDRFFLEGVGTAWESGVPVDWRQTHLGQQRRRVALPTYPFEHERFWIEKKSESSGQNHEPRLSPPSGGADRVAIDVQDDETSNTLPEPLSREDRIAQELASVLCELSGLESTALNPTASFVDLGFDSLFLTQANSRFRKLFGVRITFRQLFEEAPTIASLAGYIDSQLPEGAFQDDDRPEPAAEPAPDASGELAKAGSRTSVDSSESEAASGSFVEQVIGEQLRLMEQQIALLKGVNTSGRESTPFAAAPLTSPSEIPPAKKTTHYLSTSDGASDSTQGRSRELSDTQQNALDDLISRYTARTPESKRLAQAWRPHLADNRTIVGFNPFWKELVYQIVSDRSQGSRIWDIDGNEYIDTAMGFGTNLLGHSPEVVVDAVRAQLDRGFEVGVQNHLLGEVTEEICSITGNERLAFTYSGGEAVETAIRVARTITGQNRIAYFTDDIHGRSDIVLGRAIDLGGHPRTVPMVAGIPQHVVDDALVLEYGTERALEVIQQ